SASACCASDISIAPRGPRRVLWVVVEITSACPTGEGWAPPAIRPATWAMSATRIASASRAICAKASNSMVRGIAVPPQKISFGRSRSARAPPSSRCARAAAEDQLRAPAQRQAADLVEIGPTGVAADPVLNRAEPPAGDGDVPAVRQMPAHRQGPPHHRARALADVEADTRAG